MTPLSEVPSRRGRRLAVHVPELTTHIAIVDHLRYRAAPGWIWNHPAGGELREKRVAAKLKAMGLRPGMPDLELISPDGRWHGLELKRAGGSLSDEQRKLRDHCQVYGWPYAVAKDIDMALAVLTNWGVFSPTTQSNEGRAAA